MDLFDEIYKSIVLTEKSVLDAVDEYTLYCFYTNLELVPGRAYNAPYYREDKCPSFSIFESKSPYYEYMWKDHTTGDSGTIFNLIQKIEQLDTTKQVLARINEDFALGYNTTSPVRKEKISWYEKPEQNVIKIRIVEQPFNEEGKKFWDRFRIDANLLNTYSVNQVQYFWTYEGQPVPTTASNPTFSYRIGEYYQLYSPYADKKFKFRNDLPENYFFGYMQLPKTGKTLVIDKSAKDVIFCRRLGYNAVSGKSETTMIPHEKILELKNRFEEVYLTLDPDLAGRRQSEKYMSLYPWMKPRFLEEAKDKTDLCIKVGFNKAEEIIKEMLK